MMKLKKGADLIALIKAIKTCKGDVEFIGEFGDQLNLSSMLSEMLFLTLASGKNQLTGQLVCSNAEDMALLSDFWEEATV